MDMLPPQAPPAIVSSVDQAERDALLRLADTQAWLHMQQDDLPDPYVSAEDRERFFEDVDTFWEAATPDASLPGREVTTRRRALAGHLAKAARVNVYLRVNRDQLPQAAIDVVRHATPSDASPPPTLHISELFIGDEPQAGTLVLQDDTQPDMVLLFGTRTGWEVFPSLDDLLCEVEARLQLHLFQTDEDHALDHVDIHFLRSRPIEGPAFDTIANRLITAYRRSLAHRWDDEALCPDWEDRLNAAMQLSTLFDLRRLAATPLSPRPVTLSRPRRSPPVKPVPTAGSATGRVTGTARRTGAARRIDDHLGHVAGATQQVADGIARQLGVGVPAGQALPPSTSTLPRPQDMFSRRYSAPEVTLPPGPEPAGNVHHVDGGSYVARGGLPYRVQYDPSSHAWRLFSRGSSQGMHTGPIIDLGPNGQWEIRFPAPHEEVSRVPQASPMPTPYDAATSTSRATQIDSAPHTPLFPSVIPVASPMPIDLPPMALSELPRVLKDIVREELSRQLEGSVVDALALFRRLRRWNDGAPLIPELTAQEIDAWNAAMAGMRDRLRNVRSPSPPGPSVSDQLTDTDMGIATPDILVSSNQLPDIANNVEPTLTELLTPHAAPAAPQKLTPETLENWSDAVNEFVDRPRLTTSPEAGPSSHSPVVPASSVSDPILDAPLPAYPFDRSSVNERAHILEELGRLMPSAAEAEALFHRIESAFTSHRPVPRLTRIQENAWRGAMAYVRWPKASAYRARRMEVAEVSSDVLLSIRNRLTRLKQSEEYESLIYLRDKNKQIVSLTPAQRKTWQDVLEYVRKRRAHAAESGPSAKRATNPPHGRFRATLNDLSYNNVRSIRRILIDALDREAQLEIFRHHVNDQPITRALTDEEERQWVSALATVRQKPVAFGKHAPSDIIRDFSTTDMRELWMELKASAGFRAGENIYRALALKDPTEAATGLLPTEASYHWRRAVSEVRQRRRMAPTAATTASDLSHGLWFVPETEWPTTLYHYAPVATFAEATDHVIRLPFTRLESVGAEGIAMFTAPPETTVLSLPSQHSALLPLQTPHFRPDARAPSGSIGARSGAWIQISPAEVRDSLHTFVDMYRVGGPESTTYVLRPSAHSADADFTELWLGNPFVIHRPQP